MITLKLSEEAVLQMAQTCIQHIRQEADLVRLFTRIDNGSARDSSVRIAHRRVNEFRPLIKCAVAKFGADLFRRRGFKSQEEQE